MFNTLYLASDLMIGHSYSLKDYEGLNSKGVFLILYLSPPLCWVDPIILFLLLVSVTTQFSYEHSEYLICLVLNLPTWHYKQKMEDILSQQYTQCVEPKRVSVQPKQKFPSYQHQPTGAAFYLSSRFSKEYVRTV